MKSLSNNRYPKELKEAIVAKLLEEDVTVMDVQRETGVGINTLYGWRDKALNKKDCLQRQNIRMQTNGVVRISLRLC